MPAMSVDFEAEGLLKGTRGNARQARRELTLVEAAAADQELPMLPPTRYTLRDLAGFGSVAEALAAAAGRRVERILPVLDGAELVLPWGERYPVPLPPPDAAGPGAGGRDAPETRGGRSAVGP
jgi:hypothetical protein